MRLGIDFDNTIVCYEDLFRRLAREEGSVPPSAMGGKVAIRDFLRSAGREDVWTRMQGVAYGPRLREACPFPGLMEFVRRCTRAGWRLFVISHKTRYPYLGDRHDLHKAAWDWMEAVGLLDPDLGGLAREDVFFEPTKEGKLQRIRACGCQQFIDDLPEFLGDDGFPAGVERILFDPCDEHPGEVRFRRLRSWEEAGSVVTGPGGSTGKPRSGSAIDPAVATSPLLRQCGLSDVGRWELLAGGRNNRVWRVSGLRETRVLKEYFCDRKQGRDRFGSEMAFYDWIGTQGIGATPVLSGRDAERKLGLFEWVEGRRISSDEVDEGMVRAAIRFVEDINRRRGYGATAGIPIAAEAFFRLSGHAECIEGRVRRLEGLDAESELGREALQWIGKELRPAWNAIRAALQDRSGAEWNRELYGMERCLSPSDFGFHNALLRPDGRLVFFDFEYAGWDDPAKLAVDFFWQPRIPVPRRHWDLWIRGLDGALGWGGALGRRAKWLWPAYRIKWCCIVMNEFLESGRERRQFSGGDGGWERRCRGQLAKARALLEGWERERGPMDGPDRA